jgi:hypothetical protein
LTKGLFLGSHAWLSGFSISQRKASGECLLRSGKNGLYQQNLGADSVQHFVYVLVNRT